MGCKCGTAGGGDLISVASNYQREMVGLVAIMLGGAMDVSGTAE